MKIKYNSEMIAGAVFVIVAAVLWLLIPSQIQTMETSSINAQTIPRVAIGGLFIFSAALLIQGIFSDEKKEVVINKDTFHSESFKNEMRSVVFATIHGESSRILADCLHEAGLGALVGVVGMDRNCPDNLRNTPAEAVRDTEAMLVHTASMPRVGAIVTPRFVPSCTPEMMSALGDLARAKHLPVQSHLSENRSEIEWVRELEPASTCYGDAYRR